MQKELSAADKDNLVIYRVLALGAIIIIPLFWFVYRQSNPGAYDPLIFRLFFAAFGLFILVFSFVNKNISGCMYMMYTLFYLVLLWFVWLLYKNHFTTNYFIGFVLITYAITLGFRHHRHLMWFFITQFLLFTLVSLFTDYMEVNKFIALGTIVTMFFLSYFITHSRVSYQREINSKNLQLEEKNKDILDSIHYANRIQQAILPKKEEIKKHLDDFFILYKPKDIVSGDFYWFNLTPSLSKGEGVLSPSGRVREGFIIAAADCTGHGVPGAFMSMIGNDQLNHIVLEKKITKPSAILTELNRSIKSALKQTEAEGSTRDGMDIALISIRYEVQSIRKILLEYAGANRPLWIVKKDEGQEKREKMSSPVPFTLTEIKADKTAIGGSTEEDYQFKNHSLELNRGDAVYLFSDGYVDQFGGSQGKKFMTKQLKELLLSIQEKPMQEQEIILNDTIEKWKGSQQQVDDILVIGIRF